MFFIKNKSLLNKQIAEFYKIPNEETLNNVEQCFEDNGAYNSLEIVEFLWPQKDCDDIFSELQSYKYDDYFKCYQKLKKNFQYTQDVSKTSRKNGYDGLKIQWLGQNINKYLEMKNKSYNSPTNTVEEILLLTSLLENGLANVYLTKSSGKQAPHLLKDLINTAEVREVFGIEMILILKILMGSPNSINLRNIVWHGFPKPFEIPNYYVDVLLIIIHTMGCTIEEKEFELKERFKIVDFLKHMEVFEDDLKVDILDLKSWEQHICNIDSSNLAKDFKPYWQQLFSYYHSKNYIEFLILILPQIELLLRLHYGLVNNFDITAKLDEYYITMDTIFESDVPVAAGVIKQCNELLNFEISPFQGCFHLIYDIFISPNGCRLRDKVSHGEVHVDALNNSQLCNLVLHIFLNLLLPNEFKTLENYESKLHLNCLTKKKLNENQRNLENFNLKHFENSLNVTLDSNNSLFSKVLIFQRCKKESELMLLMKKISENIGQTLNNYEESITIRTSLMDQRELHSKRRKTLEKLKAALPEIFKTLLLMWHSIRKLYQLLQQNYAVVLDENEKCLKTLRFLKHSLTLSENFVKYSHFASNEWIKSLDICRKFEEFHEKLCLYDQ